MSKLQVLSLLTGIGVVFGVWVYFNKNNTSSSAAVPLIVFAQHPALNAVAAGIKSVLQEQMQVNEYNAQGDITTALHIAKQCAAEEPPVMIGVATPAAQAVNKARDKEKTLLGFAAVSDPHGAHLDTEVNVVGVTDTPPVEELLETMRKLFPKVTTLGVIYNPSEINSTYAIEQLEKSVVKSSLRLVVKGVNTTGMVKVVAQELIDNGAEVIYVPLDNLIVSSLSILSFVASQYNIPLIANDPVLITQGITLAVGPDFEETGKQLGVLILAHGNGQKIEEPIQLPRVCKTVVNKERAQQLALDTSVIQAELV